MKYVGLYARIIFGMSLAVGGCAKDHDEPLRDAGFSSDASEPDETDHEDVHVDGGTSSPVVNTDDWAEVTTDCGYSFTAPENLVKVPVRGTDSCVSQYISPECDYLGDYGGFSNTLDGAGAEPGERETIEIDGVKALIWTAATPEGDRWRTAVHLPVGEYVKPTLTLDASCTPKEATSFAHALFRTIKLPR
jgi:hypothetical protein